MSSCCEHGCRAVLGTLPIASSGYGGLYCGRHGRWINESSTHIVMSTSSNRSARLTDTRAVVGRLLSRTPHGSAERLRVARASLNDRRPVVRRVALQCVTALHPSDLEPLLVAALSDRSWEVRMAALEGLEASLPQGRRCPAQVKRLLRHRNRLVRLQAAEVCGVLGDRSALPQLRPLLHDRSALVRSYAAEAIGRVGTAADRRRLCDRLKHERSTSARLGLYHGLYLRGGRTILTRLIALLTSRNYLMRSATASALQDTAPHEYDAGLAVRAIRAAMKEETTPAKEHMRKTLAALSRRIRAR